MQAASSINDPSVLEMLVEAGAMKEIRHPVTGKEIVPERWQGDIDREQAKQVAKAGA